MIKGKTRKRTYKAIYRLLDRVSPVPFDCGTICGAACCTAAIYDDSLGIMLLPGEDKIHDRKDDWLSWEALITNEFEFPESWNGKVWFLRCKTPPHCPRHLRPIQCRTFPLMPHISKDGELSLIYNDFDLPYVCPMIEDETELDERFVKATKTVWRHLIRDPLIYDLVWKDSRERDIWNTEEQGRQETGQMIKVCIFDLDGTLARTQESIARPVNMTLSYYGLPEQPVEAFNYFAGDGIKNALKRALIAAGDTDASHLEEGLPMCRKWMQEDPCFHAEPYDGIVHALEELKNNGIKITVFSNKPHESAVSVVNTIFGKGFFDHIQGQTDKIPIKPDPTGVFEILEKFGAKKEECLYFGDTNTDMLTGRNAGVTTVGVTWGFRPRSELEEYKADIIIDSASEIPALAGVED